jgi:hypothetical protein
MWRKRCDDLGIDLFDAILADVATHYDPDSWKSYGEGEGEELESTAKKQRKQMKKGIELVSVSGTGFSCLILFNRVCI